MKHISCVIPAYNEEKNIGNVLEALIAVPREIVSEIIVVDDCSTDRTSEITKPFPQVRLIRQEKNGGKSKAVATGILASSGDHILMLDADLLNLTTADIIALAQPVLEGKCDVTISIRKNTPAWMKRIDLDFMSGERVIPKAILVPYLPDMLKLRNYGLEVFLNRIFIQNKTKIISVRFVNTTNDLRIHKRNAWEGITSEILLWRDIFRSVPVREVFGQNFALKKLMTHEAQK